MYNSQNGSYEVVNTNVCQNCGKITFLKHEGANSDNKQGIIFPILGWTFFVISLMFIPILFGAAAFLMGFFTFHDRSRAHGVVLIMFALGGLILGSLFSIIVSGTLFL
ncbi:hypothetical protein M3226_19400 [Neobacillus cucumis]|uniref:hypothetical protein n=1 Tax=Neobacillus cucumis TaxID=1740721 RepID=UPI00203B1DDA|nr:hypothetical protein [Neobacillus cucumis]MCM3727828.1 hypothetical protein [Neobacillus cucumis]